MMKSHFKHEESKANDVPRVCHLSVSTEYSRFIKEQQSAVLHRQLTRDKVNILHYSFTARPAVRHDGK